MGDPIMFITYIITLVKNGDYLQRCIESLYAQKNNDFEIVIADYNVGSAEVYIEEQLNQRDNLKVINPCNKDDKLFAATQLIDKSTQFIQFIEETFFATPYAIEHLRKTVKDEIQMLLPNTVIQKDDVFIKQVTDNLEEVEISGKLTAFSYCFRKDLFELYLDDLIKNLYNIESVLDVILSKGTEPAYVNQICYYVVDIAATGDIAKVEDYDNIKLICENIIGDKLSSLQVKLFIKYLHRLMFIINSDNSTYKDKCKAYETLKQFGKSTISNPALNKIFMLNVGVPYQDIENLDLPIFLIIFNESLQCTCNENISAIIANSLEKSYLRHENSLHLIESDISAINCDNELKNEKLTLEIEKIEKMHEDIIAMATNMHILMQRFEKDDIKGIGDSKVSGFLEPVNEIPYLFATGKLGFKVLIKSFNCWLRYKFSRKKK